MKKLLLLGVLISVMICDVANAGKEALPATYHLLLKRPAFAAGHAAFDGTNYLLALESNIQKASVAAQLVSSSGDKIGTVIPVGQAGQSCCSAVRFDGTNYLMIWENDQGIKNSPAPFMIYGQFINTSGVAMGQPFAMTTAGIYQDGLQVLAYGAGKYLLTYTRLIVPENGSEWNNRYIAGRIISPDGAMGDEFRISTGYGATSGVAFDGINFFVAWIEDSLDQEVRGRFVSPTSILGQEISINNSAAPSDNPPAIAYDGTNYLVLWNDEVDVVQEDWDIFGQRVSPNGDLVGGVIPVVNNETGQQALPTLVFDGSKYLAVWTDAANDANNDDVCNAGEGTCWDVYGQYLNTDGTLDGSRITINTDGGNQLGVVAASSLDGRSLVLVNNGIVPGEGGFVHVDGYKTFIVP